ncbi:MAG: Twitching motility protein [Candidatus Nomurabacteria bacterium GW2011_GWF2_35_66]|uniref:Twitching motility protein n=1 Tax=Candidatus Nomurabacteria bacterium GW2011_GWE1_35_16 TaxID=1618761 RepID=A0A0G0BBE3_9BACT|nr:MAG: Twitching motility protein [Candidatus Nomurabacteria bacterium GW2011_GWF1_34_20]KKP63606.1 MAG: Twitching motility protein [Candidatus Nomurabacteria bacterium GW2011_GWE2_34_25]KKP66808.1 MAG: Twitching motility protein [Candidatus Nomurabacteria bacterium GW2011_GWE1_35_16]KKP83434.1 MAG: Twitching motility protein [Candidatus Nomurabacteria bacterium GW2011_GWF2_35_66]HAE36634.1 type IV pili twitching motility protein PilT [Candidatus Nomurabacteria bacterium]
MDYNKFLDEVLTSLIHEDGSDLHLGAGRKPAVRINGQLVFLSAKEVLKQDDMIGILKILLGAEKTKKFLEDKEVDFSFAFKNTTHLRGNAFFQRGNICVAIRLVPKARTFEELNIPEILKTFAMKKQGFFLVVGPVGQGKSTTLSTMINYINKESTTHIITIEDPIEYVYKQDKSIIDQREIGLDTKDFPEALKSVFREDVNVILIGEMRSNETMSAAVTAAETGHLVFSTLHTNNASQTIDRIIDSFPSNQQEQIRLQLAASLLGILSQRLIPRITGGRIPAFELLINNNATANLIREKRTHEINTVIETSSEQGMIDMNRYLVELVAKGEITLESAYQYSFNPKALEHMI